MHKRQYSFLGIHELLYSMQFGFYIACSTDLSITENIISSLDNNRFWCGIFIDIRKAFDTVNHEILFKNLNIMESEELLWTGFSHT